LFFPVVHGIIIAWLGLRAGLASCAGLTPAITQNFSSDLAPGETFCTLPASYVAVTFAVTLAVFACRGVAHDSHRSCGGDT
jgi:putative ABC transport system permease protein